jgi:hypothetical protein
MADTMTIFSVQNSQGYAKDFLENLRKFGYASSKGFARGQSRPIKFGQKIVKVIVPVSHQ